MQTLSVLIASRLAAPAGLQSDGALFVEAAIQSVQAQTAARNLHLQIIIGVDRGSVIPSSLSKHPGLTVVESHDCSQAAALNAAAARIDGDLVAFIEDDDIWDPLFVETALTAMRLKTFEFVSSTQLEMSESHQPLRTKDFPTMSGWLMPRATWAAIGPFNESYRWHLDNEWLGRLTRKGATRCHLVEKGVPLEGERIASERPELAMLLKHSLGKVELLGHGISWPLVRRRVHAGSGLAQIRSNAIIKAESFQEYQRLTKEYGRLPW